MKDSPLLQPKMKPRHLQMIAVGGSIGTGSFLAPLQCCLTARRPLHRLWSAVSSPGHALTSQAVHFSAAVPQASSSPGSSSAS